MAKIYDDVTKLIGNTPLVRLNKLTEGLPATIVAKLEFYNPASSRQGPHRRRHHRRRRTRPGELPARRDDRRGDQWQHRASRSPSSAPRAATTSCSRCPKPCPRSAAPASRVRCRADPDPRSAGHEGCGGQGARRSRRSGPAPSWPGSSPTRPTPRSTVRTTAVEIWDDTDGAVDIFVAGIGTGGTITGVGQVLKERKPERADHRGRAGRIADPERRRARPAQDPGHRCQLRPRDPRHEPSTTRSSTSTPRPPSPWPATRPREEGLLVGISSGAAIDAAIQVARAP